MSTVEARFWSKVNKTDGCWLWTGARKNKQGHGNMRVGNRNVCAHRVSWTLAHGDIPVGSWVLHKCDVPACVNPDHLYLGTQKENMRDASERKRLATGDRHWTRREPERVSAIRQKTYREHPELVMRGQAAGAAKLADETAKIILSLRGGEYLQREIAAAAGVTQQAVSKIWRGRNWAHLQAAR